MRVFSGETDKAILAYNVGLGNVIQHGFSFDPNDYLAKHKRWVSHLQGSPTQNIYHTIKKGDTLSKIAKVKLGNWKLWKKIKTLNPGIDELRLKIGAKIRIR